MPIPCSVVLAGRIGIVSVLHWLCLLHILLVRLTAWPAVVTCGSRRDVWLVSSPHLSSDDVLLHCSLL